MSQQDYFIQFARELGTLNGNIEAVLKHLERVTAALDDIRAESVEKRDAAVMPSTKAIYQAFIDAIDRLKEKLNVE